MERVLSIFRNIRNFIKFQFEISPLYNLLKDWNFIQTVCEASGIKDMNDGVEAVFENVKNKLQKESNEIDPSEGRLFILLSKGIESLKEKEGVKRVIKKVEEKIEEKARELHKPTHFSTNHHLAIGIVTAYLYKVLLESGYIRLKP